MGAQTSDLTPGILLEEDHQEFKGHSVGTERGRERGGEGKGRSGVCSIARALS